MINVIIGQNSNKEIFSYKLEGHANYGDYGKDIVCAAVSVLAQTSLLSLVEVCQIKEKDLDYHIDDGYLEVNISNNIEKENFEKSQIVLKTFEKGIISLIESYPEHVTLEYRRCNKC